MALYKKPKCNCGEELTYYEKAHHYRKSKVNVSGRPSKQATIVSYSDDSVDDWLKCEKCRNTYVAFWDKRGRLYRLDQKP